MPKDNDNNSPELDTKAMMAIRAMLADETPAEPLVKRGRAVPEQPAPAAPSSSARHALPPLEPEHIPETGYETNVPQSARKAPRATQLRLPDMGAFEPFKARLLSYRPSKAHLIIGAAALLILFRPGLVIGLLFLSLFIMVGIFLVVGYDGFWRGIFAGLRWYADKRPHRAEAMHERLDNFAVKWDSFLDRFPEGSVDGLYLPDLAALEVAEQKHDEALDRRFDGLRKS